MALFSSAASFGSNATCSTRATSSRPGLPIAALVFGEVAHVGIERGIVEHGLETGEFGGLAAVFADRRRHALKPGELPR